MMLAAFNKDGDARMLWGSAQLPLLCQYLCREKDSADLGPVKKVTESGELSAYDALVPSLTVAQG